MYFVTWQHCIRECPKFLVTVLGTLPLDSASGYASGLAAEPIRGTKLPAGMMFDVRTRQISAVRCQRVWHAWWIDCRNSQLGSAQRPARPDLPPSMELNSASIYGHRCKYLNVHIYSVTTVSLYQQLQSTHFIYWSIADSGQFGCKIVFSILVHPKLI